MYIIKDWANNTCFNSKEFNSFDDAWSFLFELFDNDADLEEYNVELI
jgi:hypothetical protein